MADSLGQLQAVSLRYEAPILCAGDVFDHWRADPELVNFAINYLPEMYAIPGQHDLPLHNLDLIKRSVYWTMVLVGRIHDVSIGGPVVAENNLALHGFPWARKITPHEEESSRFHVALCHEFFWTGRHRYEKAPEAANAKHFKDRIKGWHAVAFGDNHMGFLTKVNGISVLNCGTFMRRTTREEEYQPQVGLLCESGQILVHKLRTSHETFTSLEEDNTNVKRLLRVHDVDDFLEGLSTLQKKSFDFIEAIELAMEDKKVDNQTRQLILEALGRGE